MESWRVKWRSSNFFHSLLFFSALSLCNVPQLDKSHHIYGCSFPVNRQSTTPTSYTKRQRVTWKTWRTCRSRPLLQNRDNGKCKGRDSLTSSVRCSRISRLYKERLSRRWGPVFKEPELIQGSIRLVILDVCLFHPYYCNKKNKKQK